MNISATLPAAFFLLCSHGAQAQRACPWLTEGTVTATLGGLPDIHVKISSPIEGSCTFKLGQGPVVSVLEIVVTSTPQTGCPPESPKLKGIGDEAVVCQPNRSATEIRSVIDSRVRSVYFRASLTIQGAKRTSATADGQQERLERIAEEVAGNLY